MSEPEEKKGLPGLWDRFQGAIRDNRGKNTSELVERFTSEFTLVAEGLVSDESKLRGNLESLKQSHEKLSNHVDAIQRSTDSEIDDLIQHTDQLMKEHEKRLSQLEARLEKLESAPKLRGLAALPSKSMLSQLILLASIICGSLVIVSILNLFR